MTYATFRVGAARAITSPPPGMYLVGYGDRTRGATSVHDDLTVTALVIDDGNRQAAILSLDILGLNREVVERAQRAIETRTGIPASRVLIACSHTHSGPVGYAPPALTTGGRLRRFFQRAMVRLAGPQPRGWGFNKEYIDGLVETLAATTAEAVSKVVPAHAGWAAGDASIGHNRRQRMPDGSIEIGDNPDGPVDRSVTVVLIGPEDGPPVTLVNFACHPVILGPNNYAVSADWVGVMRRTVEAETGGLCLFIQGATADVNPYMEWSKDNWPDVERMGKEVGQEVLRILSLTMQPLDLTPIRGETATFWADLDLPDTKRDGSVPTYHEELNRHLPEIPTGFVDALLNMRYPWKTVVRWVNSTPQTPIELGALRLGDVAIAALAMEPFTETGLAVKETSPAPVTLFAGYANGLTGYLPTASEHTLGGYEVEVAPYFYRLPGVFAAESEAEVVKRLGEMVKALYS